MNTIRTLAGLLLAFILVLVSAPLPAPVALFAGLGLLGMAAGTVTYRNPASVRGTTTAPTTAQVANVVIADVTMPDAATATTITHNLSGVSTDGSKGDPCVSMICLTSGTTPVGLGVTVSYTTNAVILTPITTAAGNGCTYRVRIARHSILTDYTA